MKILFVTGHSFHPSSRRASIHFLALGFENLGHEVYVLTVGASLLRLARSPQRGRGALAYRHWRHDTDGLWKRVHVSAGHLPAQKTGVLSQLAVATSNKSIPARVLKPIEDVDAIVLDSGLAVYHFSFLRARYPNAHIMYNAADDLHGVGYSGEILEHEKMALETSDSVRVPSMLLKAKLPSKAKTFYAPHGVDRTSFEQSHSSPYRPASSNAVMIGSTMLDRKALTAIANTLPNFIVHVFGVTDRFETPANVIVHGEVSFDTLVPYVQHANLALAPYNISPNNAYIAESSLKIRQYRICGLPIVSPTTLPITGEDIFAYDPNNFDSLSLVVNAALDRGVKPYNGIIQSWPEVVANLTGIISPTRCSKHPANSGVFQPESQKP